MPAHSVEGDDLPLWIRWRVRKEQTAACALPQRLRAVVARETSEASDNSPARLSRNVDDRTPHQPGTPETASLGFLSVPTSTRRTLRRVLRFLCELF